jgi:hypothetical protein
VTAFLVFLLVLLLVFGFPLLLCWIGAVTAARALRDRPIGVRATAEVTQTGFQLGLLTPFLLAAALLAAIGTVCASAYWPGAVTWEGPPLLTAGFMAAVAFIAAGWVWYLPIVRDEWRRLARRERPRHWMPESRRNRLVSARRQMALAQLQSLRPSRL